MSTYGGWALNVAQFGEEVTPGTAVAATKVWRGLFGGFEDDRKVEEVEENVGVLFPGERSRIVAEGATIPLPAVGATYEQFPLLLECGVMAATPSGTGPYLRTYTYPTGATLNPVKTYSVELGNVVVTDDLSVLTYAVASEITLEGESGALWKMGGSMMGNRRADLVSLAAATTPTVEDMPFGLTKWYIDDSGGTVGTTQVSGVVVKASFKIETGIIWVPPGDGVLYPTAHKRTRPKVTFSVDFELEDGGGSGGIVSAERAHFEAEDVRLFQFEIIGSGDNKLTWAMAIKWDNVSPYSDNDGNTVVTFEGHAVNSLTDGLNLSIESSTSLATLL